jgi:3-deoxy-D-manno-octulosonic-acid transferase
VLFIITIIIYFLYTTLLVLTLLFYGPLYVIRQRGIKDCQPDLLQRLGIRPPRICPKKGKRILIHSVSVGETKAIIPVIRELKKRCPGCEIYLTTTTGTGRKTAEQIRGEVEGIYYFPLDFGFVCASFLRRIRPDLICLTETEIWPNFIRIAARHKIPLCLINGRISDHSFKNYHRIKPLIRPLLNKFTLFCMQSAQDAQRILGLGAEPEKVMVTGNIKFDLDSIVFTDTEYQNLRNRIGLKQGQPVIVAGSTHPGEEQEIIDTFIQLLPLYPDLVLILVPRHIERSGEISFMISTYKRKCILWSRQNEAAHIAGGDILLVDVIGILTKLYSLATITFIGGSLIPHGGQNPLEPAFFSKPALFGPHMENFRHISSLLLQKGGALEVTKENLFQTMVDLLNDEKLREAMGGAGRSVVEENKGAAQYTGNEICKILFLSQ